MSLIHLSNFCQLYKVKNITNLFFLSKLYIFCRPLNKYADPDRNCKSKELRRTVNYLNLPVFLRQTVLYLIKHILKKK